MTNNPSASKKRTTPVSYITKIAVLAALSVILYAFIRIPLFPVPPFNVLKLDFASIPSLLGGFAMGPVAGVAIEGIKVLVKFAADPTETAGVGELSNFIVSIAFILPASIVYKYHKSRKGAVLGMITGVLTCVIVGALSNYFIIVPFYAKMFMPSIMNVRVVFAFGYCVALNAIKTIIASVLTYALYKRLSPILHL
ncbi:MAG: ECF transporter S component [Christensenellaceae bacterium]|jgi:riboflavin transporter FmnP|nr:ECF transporter S component [Christensenellaceae bacterium]